MLNELAALHSATSFFNSLLLEWKDKTIDEKCVRIPLQNEELIIPLRKYSRVGRHLYEGKFFIKTPAQDLEEISVSDVVIKVTHHLAKSLETDKANLDEFISRVNNSSKNIEDIIEHRIIELQKLVPGDLNFARGEQVLFAGHTCHPTPKARSEFSDEDARLYTPEFKAEFPLEWLFVDQSIFFEKYSENFAEKKWLKDLFGVETGKEIPEGLKPFPVHPFQKKILFQNKRIISYLKQKKIIEAGSSHSKWIPTSSVRTLYRKDSPFMLKFSLSVKLTNSLRNLLAHELDRGLFLHELFETPMGKQFLNENPEFRMVHEPVFAGIREGNGNLIQESLVLGRYNLFPNDDEILPAAALCMNDVNFGKNLIQKYIEDFSAHNALDLNSGSLEWFKSFFKVCITPLIRAASDYGILLGSHQQNMVIRIKNHLPAVSFFRDCNGTGFTKEGAELFSGKGIVVDNTSASYLFGYYVIINTTFNVLGAIAQGGEASEEELLKVMVSELRELKGKVRDSYLIDYLLNSEELMHKGNFLCSLRNLNENTEADPLSIYIRIKNPLRNLV